MLGFFVLQPHLKKGKKIKPGEILKFPWEEIQKEVLPATDAAALFVNLIKKQNGELSEH